MKIKPLCMSAALFAGIFMADTALAAQGYVSRGTTMRAGPGIEYPAVNRLRGGEKLTISGCVNGWEWCEVQSRHDYGWVSGQYLQAMSRHRRMRIVQAGPAINIPIIHFEAGGYWDEHYRNKPFYHDRGKWTHDNNHGGDDHRDHGGDEHRDDHTHDRGDARTWHNGPR